MTGRSLRSTDANENDSRIMRPVMVHRAVPIAALCSVLLAAGLLAGCGEQSDEASDQPVVVATAPQVEVLATELAGDGVNVLPVVPATADVHELELRPSQVRAIRDADVILRPGRGNDAWAAEGLDASSGEQVDVAADVAGDERHWWMDPAAVITAATAIAAELDRVDPAGRQERGEHLAELRAGFEEVDKHTKQCLASVPAAERRIVTDHDAIGAYASRYGLDVVGTISPGSEPEASPSAKHLVELEQLMKARGVAAVFPIAPHGSKLVPQLAGRAGAEVGEPLWADALPGAEHEHAHEEHADEGEHTGEGEHADEEEHTGKDEAGHADEADATNPAAGASLLLRAAELNGHAVAEALGASAPACREL
jgi:ABC-type Zn uptake system ZnuABC Zn-binding protein ZnuA